MVIEVDLTFFVSCASCGGRGPTRPTADDATAAWNHRGDIESNVPPDVCY